MTAYTSDIARRRRIQRDEQDARIREFVRSKAQLWMMALEVEPRGLDIAAEIVEFERPRGRQRPNLAEIALKLATAPDALERMAQIVAVRPCLRLLYEQVLKQRAEIVHANLRLVFAVARRFVSLNVQYEDMVADGNMGLFRAIDRFDPTFNVLFSTYACHWIRHEISRSIDDRGATVRVPVCARLAKKRIAAIRDRAESCGEILSEEELAERCGLRVERIRQIERDTSLPLRFSLNYDLGGDDWSIPKQELVDNSIEEAEQKLELADALRQLQRLLPFVDSRRAYVLRHRFGLDGCPELTLAEIGRRLGVSRERVRQHQVAGLEDLRLMMERSGRRTG